MPLKIKFIKDDDEGILPYCEEEDAEKFYFQQILTARFSWGSNIGFYIANEGISILENSAKLGLPLPKKLIAVLKQLKDDNDKE